MAIAKLDTQWKGIRRTFSNVYVETCYDVYADMSNASASPYLRVNGMYIYSATKASISDMLPLTLSVSVGNGTPFTMTTSSSVSSKSYSGGGYWMEYYVKLVAPSDASSNISIPNDGSAFQISVTITPRTGSAITFTESACGISPLSIVAPSEMTTARITTATLSSSVPVGNNYRVTGSFVWYPKYLEYATTEHIEDLFVDPYTRITEAASSFNSISFAVQNSDYLPDVAGTRQNGTLSLNVYYRSADFTDGCLISCVSASILVIPREYSQTDDDLLPVSNPSATVVTATPAYATVNGKYVAGYAVLNITPGYRLKYQSRSNSYGGFSLTYNNKTYYSAGSPVTIQTVPQYVSGTHTAVESFDAGFRCSIRDRWSNSKANRPYFIITLPMLGYNVPQITNFALHRCKVDSNGAYTYNGTKYTKDDYGAYALIEYGVKFSSIDNSNVANMTIRYGTTTQTITISSYTQTGYIVVPANTERTMDVTFRLWDTFTPAGIASTQRLSTAGVLIDWLAGGKGMAIGKVAETQNMLDVNPMWTMLFYQATVGAYNNNTDVDLVAWMHDIDTRLTALENSEYAN